jgi:O-antigen ligase
LTLSIDKFLIFTILSLSLIGSSHLILNYLNISLYFYALLIGISFLSCCYFIKNYPLNILYSIIFKLRFFIAFFTINFFLQVFYHSIDLSKIFILITYFISFFSIVIFSSYAFIKDENWDFFIKTVRYLFFTLVFIGLLNSIGLLESNIFFTEKKLIQGYNFGFLGNTSSILEHPITYGATITVLFSSLIISRHNSFLAYVIFLIGSFISFSRTSWLAAIFGIFYLMRKSLSFYFVFLSILIFFFSYNIDSLSQIFRFNTLGSGRELLWYYAFLMLEDNFVFGLGFDSYEAVKNFYLLDNEFNLFVFSDLKDLHNTYLTFIFESGIFLALLYYFSIINIFYNHRNHPQKDAYNYILFTFLIINFFVEFKLGGLRFINFYVMSIIGYAISFSLKKELSIS